MLASRLGEETMPDFGQVLLEGDVDTFIEGVGAHDAATVTTEDDSS